MIPFLDLKAQYASIKDEIDTAVLGVLASAQYVLGPEVSQFEEEFAAYCDAKHAVAVNTGTSALHLALLVATVSAVCYAGALPVFVDVEPVTLTMDPAKLEAAITPRTKAIVPVHLYGQMADMDAIMAIAGRHGIAVIEDACQAHGAQYKGRRAGSIGASGCFSFYPGKNLGACGEGGIVVTNNDAHAKSMRMLRDWGQERRYHHLVKGFNYRMDGIQGAILRVKLRHLDAWTAARRAHAARYSSMLSSLDTMETPVEVAYRRHVYHIYAVRCRDRDGLHRVLEAEGIQSGLHYPIPVHLQKAHEDLGYRPGDFPVSEAAARSVLSLPIYPEMTARQVEQVVKALEQDAYVS
jgi:dTDP-4-amino-4,6-dideoxygalactose transaminase